MFRKYFILFFMCITILVGFYLATAKRYHVENGFPIILLEKGLDQDKSHFSIKTKRDRNGDLLIRFSVWSNSRPRPFLRAVHINKSLKVVIMNELDFAETISFSKMSFEYILPGQEELLLDQIVFLNQKDSLVFKK